MSESSGRQQQGRRPLGETGVCACVCVCVCVYLVHSILFTTSLSTSHRRLLPTFLLCHCYRISDCSSQDRLVEKSVVSCVTIHLVAKLLVATGHGRPQLVWVWFSDTAKILLVVHTCCNLIGSKFDMPVWSWSKIGTKCTTCSVGWLMFVSAK